MCVEKKLELLSQDVFSERLFWFLSKSINLGTISVPGYSYEKFLPDILVVCHLPSIDPLDLHLPQSFSFHRQHPYSSFKSPRGKTLTGIVARIDARSRLPEMCVVIIIEEFRLD